jgi:hypothetical protein
MNGAQSLFKALVDAGITTCFANPGTSEMQLQAFPGGTVDPDFAQLRPARSRVGEMSRTKPVPVIGIGRWCTLPQTHHRASMLFAVVYFKSRSVTSP